MLCCCLQEMCVDYITAVMQKATELATLRDVKVTTEDIMFVMRKVSLDIWQPSGRMVCN